MNALVAGRFELIDQIGGGGMGTVWRAFDHKIGRIVAAKVLRQHEGEMLARFVREQGVRIKHPHVVSPYGWAADDDRVVFGMDLITGGSVDTLLSDAGALPDSYAAVLLDQLLQALEAIHGAGVVHRDIKPGNLLLASTGTGRPHLLVTDFGIAVVSGEARFTQIAASVGTLGYMSPEQARGAEPDPSNDLYAVGVVGKQMLTSVAPRYLPDQHPSQLWPWLSRLTADDPAERPATASIARAELARFVSASTPWLTLPEPPEVFDQLGPLPTRLDQNPANPAPQFGLGQTQPLATRPMPDSQQPGQPSPKLSPPDERRQNPEPTRPVRPNDPRLLAPGPIDPRRPPNPGAFAGNPGGPNPNAYGPTGPGLGVPGPNIAGRNAPPARFAPTVPAPDPTLVKLPSPQPPPSLDSSQADPAPPRPKRGSRRLTLAQRAVLATICICFIAAAILLAVLGFTILT